MMKRGLNNKITSRFNVGDKKKKDVWGWLLDIRMIDNIARDISKVIRIGD